MFPLFKKKKKKAILKALKDDSWDDIWMFIDTEQ